MRTEGGRDDRRVGHVRTIVWERGGGAIGGDRDQIIVMSSVEANGEGGGEGARTAVMKSISS